MSPRLVISHDNITARKLAEEALQKAKEQAEFANISKSAFLANTSHELRTPMTAILGYAEMLLDPNQSNEDRRASVQTIHRNGEHLLSIINDLLDISKIEAQKVTVENLDAKPAAAVDRRCDRPGPYAVGDQEGPGVRKSNSPERSPSPSKPIRCARQADSQ